MERKQFCWTSEAGGDSGQAELVQRGQDEQGQGIQAQNAKLSVDNAITGEF